jgi:hypothetical protein
MAQQAIEIAENGLVNPAARNLWKENRSGESLSGIREAKVVVRYAGGGEDCPERYND